MRCSIKKLVASGDWSDSNIWDGGTLPTSDQIVVLNGFTLNVDQSVEVRAIINHKIEFYSLSEIPQYYGENLAYGDPSKTGSIIMEGPFNPTTNPPWTLFTANWNSQAPLFQIYVSPSNPFIVGYSFPVPKIINRIAMKENYGANVSRKIQDIEIQSSNDGETWITLLEENIAGLPGSSGYYVPFDNDTAYTHYRVLIKTGYLNSNPIYLYYLAFLESNSSITDGVYTNGGFLTLDSEDVGGITLTLNDPIVGLAGGYSSGEVVTYSGTKNFTINGIIQKNHAFSTSAYQTLIRHNGTGTLNIIRGIQSWSETRDNYLLPVTTDRHYVPYYNRYGYAITSNTAGGTTNIVGNITQDTRVSDNRILSFNNHTLNITGNLTFTYRGNGDNNDIIYVSNSIVNIIGNIENYAGRWGYTTSQYNYNSYRFYSSQVNITGDYVMESIPNMNNMLENSNRILWNGGSTGRTLNWVGKIETQADGFALYAEGSEGYEFSGPIVCSPYGWFPILNLRRVNWIQNTTNTYIQFRTNENMFLISPSQTPNGTYNLVSPDTLADLPDGDDVRLGVTYGAGSYQGTLAVPPANRVSSGIPVDNTVGTAVLTADDIWNAQTSAMNTDGSIGKRLKNASTVDSTGDQLSSLI